MKRLSFEMGALVAAAWKANIPIVVPLAAYQAARARRMNRVWKTVALASLGLVAGLLLGLPLVFFSVSVKALYMGFLMLGLDMVGGVGLIMGARRSEYFYFVAEEWSRIEKRPQRVASNRHS